MQDKTVLFRRDVSDRMQYWVIVNNIDSLSVGHGLEDGNITWKDIPVSINKSGRSLEEQSQLEFESRVNKKLDAGYTRHRPKPGQKPVNALGFMKPMLAKKLNEKKHLGKEKLYVQPKYDGNRCILMSTDNGPVAYSRSGKRIHTIEHILQVVAGMPVGTILDGELYCHGVALQAIVSWIKRKQHETSALKFMCYDVIDDGTFEERFINHPISFMFKAENDLPIVAVPTMPVSSMSEVKQWMGVFRSNGYEGLMLRSSDCPYEDGKRSESLVKYKEWEDGEFKIVDIEESNDCWGILVLETKDGNEFKCVPPGNMDERHRVSSLPSEYIGRHITVEYAFMTNDGIPFQPIAKCYVEDKQF